MKLLNVVLLLLVDCWFGTLPTLAEEPLPTMNPSAVTLWDASGNTVSGMLSALSAQSVMVVSDGTAKQINWREVVLLRFSNRPKPSDLRGAAIWLSNGDRLIARGKAIQDERLIADWLQFLNWPPLSIPLESVRGFSLALPRGQTTRDAVVDRVLHRKEASDELSLFNGDTVTGELEAWNNGEMHLKGTTGNLVIRSQDVLQVGLNPQLVAPIESNQLCWLVSLSDGSRVTLPVSQCVWTSGSLKAKHVTRVVWDIPLAAICELRVLRGQTTWLSDLRPLEVRHTPFVSNSRAWPMRHDQSVTGGALRLDGREFPKGLGLHSRSTATFELHGRFRAFRSLVGFDDSTTGTGTSQCSLEVDGRRVWGEPRLRRGQPIEVSLTNELIGAKRLTLVVDFGDQGDVQDHVNWCDAVLLP